jgi:hypothetical protein
MYSPISETLQKTRSCLKKLRDACWSFLPASQIGILYSNHIAAIKALHGDDVDLYLTAAPDIQKLSLASRMTQPLSSGLPADSAFGAAEISVFDDENSSSELVYAMGVNW